MRRIGLGLVWSVGLAFLCGASGPSQAAPAGQTAPTGFVRNAPDLPLMPGFSELEEEALVFDKPDGKIAVFQAVSASPVSPGAVRQFYRETLPELGWAVIGAPDAGSYVRGSERLRLTVERGAGKTFLRFELAPLTKPAANGGASP